MSGRKPVPRRKRAEPKRKVSVYLPMDAWELYEQGAKNGWDMPRLAREAVCEALKFHEPELRGAAD